MESQDNKAGNTNKLEGAPAEANQDKHHHGIMEVIEEAISHLNTEFPLSGGEPDEEIISSDDIVSKEHLNDNFPLSGGNPV